MNNMRVKGPMTRSTKTTAPTGVDKVDALAARALSVSVSGRPVHHAPRPLAQLFLELLHEAALAPDQAAPSRVVTRMIAAGIRPDEIADIYIPTVARRMGDMWCEDTLGFAYVTIGCARLQALLRTLGPEWQGDRTVDPVAPAILLIVGDDAQHTMGATVLAGQIRRLGLSVRLLVGARAEDVKVLVRQMRFDGVMISASVGESLEPLRKLVEMVSTATISPPPPPVIIGGTITTMGNLTASDIKALTGATLVTCDLTEALTLCGMTAPQRVGVPETLDR